MIPSDAMHIRGHHLVCMFGFRGLGYSPAFAANMEQVVARFFSDEGARVVLMAAPDDICSVCPRLGPDGCAASDGGEERVAARDRTVLDRLGLSAGEQKHSRDLARLVVERIAPADLDSLCAPCSWLPAGYCAEGLAARAAQR